MQSIAHPEDLITRTEHRKYFNRLLNDGLVNLGNLKDMAGLLDYQERVEKLRKIEELLNALRLPDIA